MVAKSPGPAFPVHVDERELAQDLAHSTEAGRAAIESTVRHLQEHGAPVAWLRKCEPEHEMEHDHPGAPWRPSVYEIAHRRLNRESG